jgi:hypothetical protein
VSAAVAHQLGCLEELLTPRDNGNASQRLLDAVKEARRIHDEFLRQKNVPGEPTELIEPKCSLLLRLKAPSNCRVRSVGDFALDNGFSVDFVVQCLRGQRFKIALTVVAFPLMRKGYDLAREQGIEEFAQMLSDALGGIDDFGTLAGLFNTSEINEGQMKYINDALLYIARLLTRRSPLVRFAFRFFRKVTGLAGVQHKFVEILFAKETRELVVSHRSLFALAFSMMRHLGTVPEMLETSTAADPLKLLLQAEAFLHARIVNEFVKHYVDVMVWPEQRWGWNTGWCCVSPSIYVIRSTTPITSASYS